MLARRIIAVSPDEAFGNQLVMALGVASAAVELHRALETLEHRIDAALCIVHVAGAVVDANEIASRLSGDCAMIAILPRANLATLVELMQASERVVGMLIAEDFAAGDLVAMATRALTKEIFGLDRLLARDTHVHSVICEYEQRSSCRSKIMAFAEQCGVRRRLGTSIDQCVDEMLMNALYDAPVDASGTPIFAGISTRARVALRIRASVVVAYACDSKRFAVSVRDRFGSLERATVLRVLHKCLHGAQKIDRKAGGGGVGLYLMVNASSAVYFNVIPGSATEAICVFTLDAPKQQLQAFGVMREPTDATGVLATEPLPSAALRPLPIQRARAGLGLFAAGAVAAVALLGAVALSRLRGGEQVQPAIVEIDSKPQGARVEIDGRPAGETPLTLTSLAPNTTATLTFKLTAYRDTTAKVRVPARGQRIALVQQLVASDDFVRVRFASKPPGAQVVRIGAQPTAARTYAPAELFVEVGKPQHFMLTMPNHVPLMIEPFTVARGDPLVEKGGTLVPGVTLRIEAAHAGKASVAGAAHCQELAVPAECTLVPGRYVIDYAGANAAAQTRTLDVKENAIVEFE